MTSQQIYLHRMSCPTALEPTRPMTTVARGFRLTGREVPDPLSAALENLAPICCQPLFRCKTVG